MFARFIALKIIVGLLLFSGCSAGPPKAPARFVAPSTEPIKKAIAIAKSHVESAKQKTIIIGEECPQAKAMVFALSQDLDATQLELTTAETERAGVSLAYDKQTGIANWYADAYTTDQQQIATEHARGNKWFKRFFLSAGLVTALVAWTLRGPLLAVVTGVAKIAGRVVIP